MDQLHHQALTLVRQKLGNQGLQRHCLAVEAIMRGLARHYGEPEDIWGLAGLLHDVDYEATEKDLSQHSLLSASWLEERGFPLEVIRAVKVHNQAHGFPLETRLERCLITADALAGLLVAATLVLPSKKIADLKVESVLKRFKEPSFARGVNREEILRCAGEDLPLEEFVALGLEALKGRGKEIGL